MNENSVNKLILEKVMELSENQAALKSSVEAHLDKASTVNEKVDQHDKLLNQHSNFFKIFFWVATTIGGIVAVAKVKL